MTWWAKSVEHCYCIQCTALCLQSLVGTLRQVSSVFLTFPHINNLSRQMRIPCTKPSLQAEEHKFRSLKSIILSSVMGYSGRLVSCQLRVRERSGKGKKQERENKKNEKQNKQLALNSWLFGKMAFFYQTLHISTKSSLFVFFFFLGWKRSGRCFLVTRLYTASAACRFCDVFFLLCT